MEKKMYKDEEGVWRSKIDGSYVGLSNSPIVKFLQDREIEPQKAKPQDAVSSIGFCEKENKWWGWSHRAVGGFTIGSEVRKGDISYVPADEDDFLEDCIRFWSDETHLDMDGKWVTDDNLAPCVQVTWTNSSDPDLIPNEKARGQKGSTLMYPGDGWGRGEWTAETIKDAMQMAIDYAENIA
jgi:hypothetical protein